MALGKLDSYMQKNETGQLSYNLYKNKLKMTRDLNIVPETIKLPEENIGNIFFHTRLSNVFSFSFFFVYISLGKGNKSKSKQMGPRHIKNLLHSQGNYQQNEKAAY